MSVPVIKILVVDDDPVDNAIINDLLNKNTNLAVSFQTYHASSLNEALTLLKQKDVDVTVLDLNLPDSKGLDTLKRFHEESPHIPVVINTGVQDHDLGLEAVIHGAQDFLMKGEYSSFILVKSLFYAIERKRQEDMLRDAYENLRRMQQQLLDTEKMRLVGMLASGIAHEVKNPLAIIVHGAEYLKQKLSDKDKDVLHTLDTILNAAQRANVTIKDLMDLAHPSQLHIERVNLKDLIDKTIHLLHHTLNQQNIHVEWVWDDPRLEIDGDRVKLEQVFMNIFLNALPMMPNGGKLIIKSSIVWVGEEIYKKYDPHHTRLHPGTEMVLVVIEDTGPGFSSEPENFLHPFATTRRAKGGMGLGLAICANLMKSHNGLIHLENRDEGGARVSLLFPHAQTKKERWPYGKKENSRC